MWSLNALALPRLHHPPGPIQLQPLDIQPGVYRIPGQSGIVDKSVKLADDNPGDSVINM